MNFMFKLTAFKYFKIRKKMKKLTILLLAPCFVFVNNTTKANNLNIEIIQCTEIKDNKKRLQCFDNYVAKNLTAKEQNKTKHLNPIKAPAANTQTDSELISSFGQAHRYSEKEREFDELTAIIKTVSKTLRKEWKIELENGQIWLQKGGDKRAKFSEGDSIIIVRGIMNSFQLKKVGTKRRIRVNRIK